MPRSIQDILDHADELAHRFEHRDAEEATEIPVEEYLLQRAVVARARTEQQVLDAVARPDPPASPGRRSAPSSAPPPRQHNSATAPSSNQSDIARIGRSGGLGWSDAEDWPMFLLNTQRGCQHLREECRWMSSTRR
jgi:hypothetical protein